MNFIIMCHNKIYPLFRSEIQIPYRDSNDKVDMDILVAAVYFLESSGEVVEEGGRNGIP